MKKIHYNYLKPQNYYNRLLTFFLIISLSLSIILINIQVESIEIVFIKFIVIIFLIFLIAALIEHFYKGEYMNPLEIYEVEQFYLEYISYLKNNEEINDKYFNKYDSKTKKNLSKIFKNQNKHKYNQFFLSSIRKDKQVYTITVINERKLAQYFFLKFLITGAIHKIYVKNIDKKLKIIRVN